MYKNLSAAERSMLASAAAHDSWANTHDRTARTAPARAALEQKFLDQAEGDPIRAAHIRKAYFQRLAAHSAKARRTGRNTTSRDGGEAL